MNQIIEKPTREQLERLLDAIRDVELEPGEGIEILVPYEGTDATVH